MWPDADHDRLLELYHVIEPHIEEHGDLTYDEVLVRALAAAGAIEGLSVPMGREHALAESLPSWPPFAEVPGALADLRGRGWKLGVLSNTDPNLLAPSVESIGVPFDVSITEAETGSYKPAHAHWERFFADTGADRAQHVHVGGEPLSRHRAGERDRAQRRVDQQARGGQRPPARRRASRPHAPARHARRARLGLARAAPGCGARGGRRSSRAPSAASARPPCGSGRAASSGRRAAARRSPSARRGARTASRCGGARRRRPCRRCPAGPSPIFAIVPALSDSRRVRTLPSGSV